VTGSFSYNKWKRGNQILYSLSSQTKKAWFESINRTCVPAQNFCIKIGLQLSRGLTAALPIPSYKSLFRVIRAPEAVRRAFRADDLGAPKMDGNDGEWAHVFPQFLQRY
jgi:hypothetical protein